MLTRINLKRNNFSYALFVNKIFTSEEDLDKHLYTHNMSNMLNTDVSRERRLTTFQTSELVNRRFDIEMHEELTQTHWSDSALKTEHAMENTVKQKVTTMPHLKPEGFSISSSTHKALDQEALSSENFPGGPDYQLTDFSQLSTEHNGAIVNNFVQNAVTGYLSVDYDHNYALEWRFPTVVKKH